MYTEMDRGIQTVIDALKDNKMWENTVLIFVSDNGGPLDHCTNEPLRGGKHTFFEGGVRVMSFVSGPLVPPTRRGTRWSGMAASADWYKTITEVRVRGICIYIYIYIGTYTGVPIHIYIYMYTYVYKYVCTFVWWVMYGGPEGAGGG